MGKVWLLRSSAGSGKTFQLALRYLRILSEYEPDPQVLRRILAITFTNKAVAEMKNRILTFLKHIAFETEYYKKYLKDHVPMESEKAVKWIEIIIDHYTDFNVKTIDSFLLNVVKAFSFKLGIKPELKVLFGEKEVLDEAFDVMLSYIGRSKEYESIWHNAIETYLECDEYSGFYIEKNLRKKITEDLFYKITEHVDFAFDFGGLKELKEKENALLEEIAKESALGSKDKAKLRKDLIAYYENGDNSKNFWNVSKDKIVKWYELYVNIIFNALVGYASFVEKLKEITEDICKREGIVLGNHHWTELALNAICEKEGLELLYLHLAGKIEHFLIDEFQDTSLSQWKAIYPLIEDAISSSPYSSVFLVGDQKQSIYCWRGGDWRIYDYVKCKNEYFSCLDDRDVVEEILCENWRSHKDLVSFFNALFGNFESHSFWSEIVGEVIGRKVPSSVKEFFISSVINIFRKCGQIHRKDEFILDGFRIFVFEVRGSSKDSVKEKIRDVLVRLVKENWESLKEKEIRENPIAILVRTNREGKEVAKWLIEEGLPVVTENSIRVMNSRVIKGIISLLSIVNGDESDFHVWGVLSSGLIPEVLYDEGILSTLWINPVERSRLRGIVFSLADRIRKSGYTEGPYGLIWIIVKELNLKERFFSDLRGHKIFVDRFLEVAYKFAVEKGASLSSFLELCREDLIEEKVGLPEFVNAIRVMTIHKAKGLEFPIVFVPFTDFSITTESPVCLYEDNGKTYAIHLRGVLPNFLDELKRNLVVERAIENINLFYVSLTRAKEKLYIFLPLYEGFVGYKPLSHWISSVLKETIEDCKNKGLSCCYEVV